MDPKSVNVALGCNLGPPGWRGTSRKYVRKFVISCDGEEQRRAVVAAQVTKQRIELIVIYVGS